MRKHIHIIISIIAFLSQMPVYAQFYVTGDDPGRLRWNSISTGNYRVIYPQGCDSLARVYALKLETFRIPVSRTTGYCSEGHGTNLMPVVMHTFNTSNGSVAWAPKRMDLFTIPSADAPVPIPWSTMLSVHESRHVTQMQFGMTGALKPFNWFFGEMFNILASLLYPGISLMEGDAVIAETAFTKSGRGRNADFLNYYRIAFDNSDFRTWDQWRFVSQKYYAPSYYSLGYMTLGGFRMLYDCPEFMSEVYHLAARRPYNLGALYTTTKKLTGKRFNKAFMEVCDTLHRIWTADAEERAPFIPSEPVSMEPRLYTDYSSNVIAGDTLYAVKSGHMNVPELVMIDNSGREKTVTRLSSSSGRMQYSEISGRILWSEAAPDERWTMDTGSKIRYINAKGRAGGHKTSLTSRKDGIYHNPYPSDNDCTMAAICYRPDGRSSVTILGEGGILLEEHFAPDSLQTVEPVLAGDTLYVTAISEGGYGIYRVSGSGEFETVLPPAPVMIKDFGTAGNELMFTSDRTGVNELYHLDPRSGKAVQKTVTRYGASDFHYNADGSYLYYSSPTMKGMRIFRTPSDSLVCRPADFTELHKYPIAEAVTRQERQIAQEKYGTEAVPEPEGITISKPERYRKAAHMFNLHSWTPFYVNVDNIMNMSFDRIYQAISLGAAGIMQNRLATAVGEFGYSAHKDPYQTAKWRHSAHARLTYSGLYPVLEAKIDFNDRAARQTNVKMFLTDKGTVAGMFSSPMGTPYFEAKFSAYIPFRFSSGGWHSGVIPKVSYSISNDRFNTSVTVLSSAGSGLEQHPFGPVFIVATEGKNRISNTISGSLRAYTMLGTSNSAVYPRWGAGVEFGTSCRLESREFNSQMGYAYVYGYIPGFTRIQGFRLSVMHQQQLDKRAIFSQPTVNTLPRGAISETPQLLSYLTMRHPCMTKLTVDYAIPIYIGELSIGGSFFSIKRLTVSPHADFTFAGKDCLMSFGADAVLDMHSILTLEWPLSIGVTWSYAAGPSLGKVLDESGMKLKCKSFFGPVFNVSF